MEVASGQNITASCSSNSAHSEQGANETVGFDDFIQSGRTGRRNAVPDIVDGTTAKDSLPEIASEG